MGDKPEYFGWFSKKSLKVKRKLFENGDGRNWKLKKRRIFGWRLRWVGFKGFNSSCLWFESYCLGEEEKGWEALFTHSHYMLCCVPCVSCRISYMSKFDFFFVFFMSLSYISYRRQRVYLYPISVLRYWSSFKIYLHFRGWGYSLNAYGLISGSILFLTICDREVYEEKKSLVLVMFSRHEKHLWLFWWREVDLERDLKTMEGQ